MPDEERDRGEQPPDSRGADTHSGTPRWVKAVALMALLLVVALVIAMVAVGHPGPSRHTAPAPDGLAGASMIALRTR